MKPQFERSDFFKFMGHPSSVHPYHCKDARSLSIYCRGRLENLEELLRPTPFEVIDDRFVISVSDLRNVNVKSGFMDAGVVVPVRYGDYVGATTIIEYEDVSFSVAWGREGFGYPKRFAHIDLSPTGDTVTGRVHLGGETLLSIRGEFSPEASNDAYADLALYPHLQVHAHPAIDRNDFSIFQIISRDTSKDFVLKSVQRGQGSAELSSSIAIDDVQLEIVDVLGAEYSVGDFAATVENGMATVIDDLSMVRS